MSLKCLTLEEASQYYSKEEDKLGAPLMGFTLTKDLDDPRWDKVTYYTTRRKISEYKGEGRYYIYVLENDTMPGVLKIGYTGKKPEERATQLSKSTGVPTPFRVAFAVKCHDGEGMEYEVHQELKEYRVNNDREFFSCTLNEAQKAIEKIGQRYV